MQKPVVAAFDFDGTITDRDTFPAFIGFVKGRGAFVSGFLLFAPWLLAYKLRLYPNWKIKQRLFSYYFKGMELADFDRYCEDFFQNSNIVRPEAEKAISKHLENGDATVVVSAGIENCVRPFAEKLGIPNLLCTKIEVDNNNRLTGFFSTPNCYGPEKVKRLSDFFGEKDGYYLVAYGDSGGDKELLELADEKYFKKF